MLIFVILATWKCDFCSTKHTTKDCVSEKILDVFVLGLEKSS